MLRCFAPAEERAEEAATKSLRVSKIETSSIPATLKDPNLRPFSTRRNFPRGMIFSFVFWRSLSAS